ncbi:hypothetical protein [Natronococcus sp.]|uniref:hypothetical protein n=1 Tax=Natronococcus sp. TaxID=35747 RepID=UPI003A4E282C
MNEEYDTRVTEILDEASDESGTLLTSTETPDGTGHSLIEVAKEADGFVASSEPTELLEAVGLGTLEDGSEAESVSEAITKGDPERVEDLHRLLCLAKLGDRSDEETLEDATGGIREAIRQTQSETDGYDTRVAEILNEASDESGTLLTSAETADDAGHSLIQVAREADEFVASSEPMALLEAVGLGTLPDGSEAESVSEAIAKGDPERVEDLHRLLRLAKLGDRSDEEQLEDATVGIRKAINQAQSETDETMTEDTDQDETPDRNETEQKSAADDESETEAEDGNGEDADDLGDRLRAAMSSSLEEISGIGKIKEQLEGTTTDDEDDVDEMEEADEGSDEDDEDDGGLLGLGDNSGGGLGSSGSSHHSTMAPPPSERADMHAVKRYSTMPKRNK